MTLTDKALDQFRDAWHAAEGDDFASRLQRQSLEALAAENDALRPVLFELTNRAQSELDLPPLNGATVHGHEADSESRSTTAATARTSATYYPGRRMTALDLAALTATGAELVRS